VSVYTYDTDSVADVETLRSFVPAATEPQIFPRTTTYGSPEALELGLEPVESVPDVLIPQDEYPERIAEAHQAQTLPIYHMYATWRPAGTRYNQDGLGYCWTWSGTGCLMTTRACEDKETVLLAPASMGYLVQWRNRGNFLESFISGARQEGVCPAPDGNFNDLTRNAKYWSEIGQRDKYRLAKVWDTDSRNMVQHCVSILCYGRSLYTAYNWWGHAVEVVGIRYEDNKLHWDISNSHNESDVITLTGSRAVPSEAYGFISTLLA